MSDKQQVARDPFFDTVPKKVWLSFSNVCKPGMFKVTLEVNGRSKELFHSYVEQGEVVVSESWNLTWLINNAVENAKAEFLKEFEDQTKVSKYMGEAIALKKENDRLREALSFYANSKNWTSMTDGYRQLITIDESDQIHTNHPDFPTIRTGGKRAKEALEK